MSDYKSKIGMFIESNWNMGRNSIVDGAMNHGASADREIASLQSELKDRDWISVEDRWPEPNQWGKVLGFNGSYCFECEFDDGFWCNIGGEEMTHWIPLPSPPKEQEKDNG